MQNIVQNLSFRNYDLAPVPAISVIFGIIFAPFTVRFCASRASDPRMGSLRHRSRHAEPLLGPGEVEVAFGKAVQLAVITKHRSKTSVFMAKPSVLLGI